MPGADQRAGVKDYEIAYPGAMCGIAGLYRPVKEGRFGGITERMAATLRHRGPDEAGSFAAPGIGLAMRRLAIIDLETGRQPIANEDGLVHVVCNGEIYNHRELRAHLEARGHRFRTKSDTEVLVHLYEEKGAGMVNDLNGMFGLAVYDQKKHRLFLARDAAGVKPLYWTKRADGSLAFASELKALVLLGDAWTLDTDAVGLYLAHLCVPAPATIYREVRKLPPGHLLEADAEGIAVRRYFRPTFSPPAPPAGADPEHLTEELTERLAEAVKRHLIADVERGAFLSGGVDSTLVVLLMREALGEGVKTFSVGFRERSFDESKWIRRTVRELGLDHKHLVLDPPAPGLADRLLAYFDEPFADYSAIPTFAVAEAAAAERKVVLSGDGGDELFGGYPTYQHDWADDVARLPLDVRRAIVRAAGVLPESYGRIPMKYRAARLAQGAHLPDPARHLFWRRAFVADAPPGEPYEAYDGRASLFTDPPAFPDPAEVLAGPWRETEGVERVRRLCHLDFSNYLPDFVLTKADRMTMAHGLELRVPYLDREIIDWAVRVPGRFLVSRFSTKRLLRRALERRLPGLARLPKRGFACPLGKWLRGPLRGEAEETLRDGALEGWGFSRAAVGKILDEHLSGRRDRFREVWALIVLCRFLSKEIGAGRRHRIG